MQSCTISVEINPLFTEIMQDCFGTSYVSIFFGDAVVRVKVGDSRSVIKAVSEKNLRRKL